MESMESIELLFNLVVRLGANFGVTLASVWGQFGLVWDGTTLGSLWGSLVSVWGQFGVTLVSLWDQFGISWESLWAHFRCNL